MAKRGPFHCLHCPGEVEHVRSPYPNSGMGEFLVPRSGGLFLYRCPLCHSNYLTPCMPPEYDGELIREVYEEVKRAHGEA